MQQNFIFNRYDMDFLKCIFTIVLCISLCFGDDPAPYKEEYLTQYLNHFSFNDDRTFQQRYLYNGKFLFY